ncbi:hypothetical protein [Tropicimonas sp. S265A]|uniref:hypothetical protein n=1 Tax=Tropicimonas sp. S265A TaxID=3415134 RepID=UPI003C7E919F
MAERSLPGTLKNLALALLNATLLLLAVCLFLAWQLVQSFADISTQLTETLTGITPLRTDVQVLSAESAALRAELTALRDLERTGTADLSQGALARIAGLEARLTEIADRVDGITSAPETLMIAALDHALDRATGGLTKLADCKAPDT